MSLSGTSTVTSILQGVAEAPSGAGVRSTEDEEVLSRPSFSQNLSRMAAITGLTAQEEARVRAIRRAHLMSTLKERTTRIPGLSPLWDKLEAIEYVSTLNFLTPCAFLGRARP